MHFLSWTEITLPYDEQDLQSHPATFFIFYVFYDFQSWLMRFHNRPLLSTPLWTAEAEV